MMDTWFKLPPRILQNLKITAIEEEAVAILNAKIQQDEDDNVDIEPNKFQQAVETERR